MSRFQDFINENIRAAGGDVERWLWKLRLAVYFARRGYLESSRELINQAREKFGNAFHVGLIPHIIFAESVQLFYAGRIDEAMDKMNRCEAVKAMAIYPSELGVAASAWQAHFSRNVGDIGRMLEQVRRVVETSDTSNSESIARICLVMADSHHDSGSLSRAERWYHAARVHALKYGDDALVGALLYNRAAIRVFNNRLDTIEQNYCDIEECQIDLEAASASNYTTYTRDNSMPWFFDLLRGQLLVMNNKLEDAVLVLESAANAHFSGGWIHLELLRKADHLYCASKLGLVSHRAGFAELEWIEEQLADISLLGDHAIICYRLSQVADNLHLEAQRIRLESQASELLASFRRQQTSMMNELVDFEVKTDGERLNRILSS